MEFSEFYLDGSKCNEPRFVIAWTYGPGEISIRIAGPDGHDDPDAVEVVLNRKQFTILSKAILHLFDLMES